MIRNMRGIILAAEVISSRVPSRQVAQIRKMRLTASGAVSVPAACPTRWSIEGYHGYSRATPQVSQPGLTQVGRVAEET